MFNDIQLCSQNSPIIVADISNSSCFKFVKSICNHSILISSGSVFSVGSVFQVVQCVSVVRVCLQGMFVKQNI